MPAISTQRRHFFQIRYCASPSASIARLGATCSTLARQSCSRNRSSGAPALSKIVTAYYTKDTLMVIGLDPASLAVINIAAIPLKLDYYPGNVGVLCLFLQCYSC